MFEALAESYGWHYHEVLWRYTLAQIMRLLAARKRRVEREQVSYNHHSESSSSEYSWMDGLDDAPPPDIGALKAAFSGI